MKTLVTLLFMLLTLTWVDAAVIGKYKVINRVNPDLAPVLHFYVNDNGIAELTDRPHIGDNKIFNPNSIVTIIGNDELKRLIELAEKLKKANIVEKRNSMICKIMMEDNSAETLELNIEGKLVSVINSDQCWHPVSVRPVDNELLDRASELREGLHNRALDLLQ